MPDPQPALETFLKTDAIVMPEASRIFAMLERLRPDQVNVVILGEDPYPRPESAVGIAFYDGAYTDWSQSSRNNSLKHILKALLIHQGRANHQTSIAKCRQMAPIQPPDLFEHWIAQGVCLLNTALTYTSKLDKSAHFRFWKPYMDALLCNLNATAKPLYIGWGKKAQAWIDRIPDLDEQCVIRQGHPAYQHQFLYRDGAPISPFTEISERSGFAWLPE